MTPNSKLAPHPSFKLLRYKKIGSLQTTIAEYEHRLTGAKHYHLSARNEENVFLVAFRTVPEDSTGVAHILEHTVLCGSEKFQVRDPFFLMTRRSLNTFMNAFTSSDWTAYPFATQNKKDFNNLLEIYLDAVFFPLISPLDFAQEGYRIEFSEPNNPKSELVYKGIVYNEMKGALSSPVSYLWHRLSAYLYPTSTYHYNSGGDPENIVDLSYEQVQNFYKAHYHPSNSIFFTYGEIPPAEHQALIHNQALSRFDRQALNIEILREKRYFSPVAIEENYAFDEKKQVAKKTHIVLAWLLGESKNHQQLLEAHLLANVLLQNSASPLLHALEISTLGTSPSPLCGLEDHNREMSFVCGLEGSDPEHAQAVENLIFEVLQKVAEEGVPKEQVAAVLHQLELRQREIGGGSYPYGLQLILAALPTAIHRGDPISTLDLEPDLKALRQAIEDENFIKNLCRNLLLNNPHRVRLTLKPDLHLQKYQQQMVKEELAKRAHQMTAQEKREVVSQAKKLLLRQQQPQDTTVLPKVTLKDIPPKMKIANGKVLHNDYFDVHFYPQGVNGLVYEEVVIDLPALDDELLHYLPLYTACFGELGVGARTYQQQQAYVSRVTGGISATTFVRGDIDNSYYVRGTFVLKGKALVNNHRYLTNILQETLYQLRFDEYEHLGEIISQLRSAREDSIPGHGHSLAMLAASNQLSPGANIAHRLQGLVGIQQLIQFAEAAKDPEKLKNIGDALQYLHQKILHAPRRFLVVSDKNEEKELVDYLVGQWQSVPVHSESFHAFVRESFPRSVREGWLINTQVNFCAKAYPTVSVTHADAPALTVLASFLKHGFLHSVIREQGGAYGGGATHDSEIAAFRFYSYRDPRLGETLHDFDRAMDWLMTEKHSYEQLEEAILGIIAAIDKPSSPAGEARNAFYSKLYGRTKAFRQQYRQRITQVTLADLQRVAQTYLQPDKASVAVLTQKSLKHDIMEMGLTPVTLFQEPEE